ncbi:MAG: DUF349 domain-containing protein [Deltaproteobacteria bacterium]|nr:DUF349 domain-containing protein [Deltaproteobacteria bacterium]
MGFIDLFRPKWKHSDATVRAQAVRQLETEQSDTLANVLRSDPDPAVRRIALKKVQDASLLEVVAREDPERELREEAAARLGTMIVAVATSEAPVDECLAALGRAVDQAALAEVAKNARHEVVRAAALDRLTDGRLLAEVARQAREPGVRMAALRRVQDPAVLRSIVLAEENKETALAALQRIEDPALLEEVVKKTKLKAVRRRAQQQLATLKPETPGAAKPRVDPQTQHRQLQIVRKVEALVRSAESPRAAEELVAAEAAWDELDGELDLDLARRFLDGCKAFALRKAEAQAQAAERAKRVQALQSTLQARQALLDEAEKLSGEEAAAQVEELRARWAALPAGGEAELSQRFQRACEAAVQRVERAERAERPERAERAERAPAPPPKQVNLAELCEQAEALLDEPRLQVARRKLEGLRRSFRSPGGAAEGDEALVARFEQVVARLDEREADDRRQAEEERLENHRRLEELCRRLEKFVTSGDLRAVERGMRDAQQGERNMGPMPNRDDEQGFRQRLAELRQKLYGRLQELKQADEWKRWSNLPRLEALAQGAEDLLKVEDVALVAEGLRELQNAWKAAGAPPKEKGEALWQRFKAATDQLNERAKVYFAEQKEQRAGNVQKKEELCAKAEELAKSEDWNATAEALKQLQAEWKAVGPVPRAQSDALWTRFRAACDAFFEKRKAQLEEQDQGRLDNLKQKEALCEKAEALADSTEWGPTSQALKGLQAQWKKIGAVPRSQAEPIWRRFRGACDRFFDRRKAQLEEQAAGKRGEREALCGRLEALGQPAEGAELEAAALLAQALEVYAAWKKLGDDGETAALERRFGQALSALLEAHLEVFKGSELDPQASLPRREKICQRLEELVSAQVSSGPEASGAASVEQMADKLREALAANAMRSSLEVANREATAEELERLKNTWVKLGPIVGPEARSLADRFERACAQLNQPS